MRMIWLTASTVTVLTLTACAPSKGPVGATDAAICRAWGSSLPTRSHSDTPQTQHEVAEAYADFAAVCPAFQHLIPGGKND